MAEITAALVKELREKTGTGMMDCKTAHTETGADGEAAAKDLGAPIEIAGFHRFQLGEGVEREESDFAAEVAAQLGR